jgi:hypothetical protein
MSVSYHISTRRYKPEDLDSELLHISFNVFHDFGFSLTFFNIIICNPTSLKETLLFVHKGMLMACRDLEQILSLMMLFASFGV